MACFPENLFDPSTAVTSAKPSVLRFLLRIWSISFTYILSGFPAMVNKPFPADGSKAKPPLNWSLSNSQNTPARYDIGAGVEYCCNNMLWEVRCESVTCEL